MYNACYHFTYLYLFFAEKLFANKMYPFHKSFHSNLLLVEQDLLLNCFWLHRTYSFHFPFS